MELHDLTAVEQARAIRSGEISSLELTEHYLARTARLNDVVGAFVTVTEDLARRQAADADRRVRDGVAGLSGLHGVVVPVKDLHLYQGVRVRFGSHLMDMVAPVDEFVAERLRNAGTVMTGKTTTPEFGLPAYTEPEPEAGPWARTPWDLTRSAGGSSGGAAAAVAAGLAPVAHGSDGGGSIRIPASACGLVGLKTSRGLLPNGPQPEGPGRLGVQGPLARTVADAAALLDVMAATAPDNSYLAGLQVEPGSLLIGRYATPVIASTQVHREALAAYELASVLLESLGHRLVDLDVPVPLEAVPHFELVWAGGAATIPLEPDQEDQVRPLTRWLRERGKALTAEDLDDAVRYMQKHARAALESSAHVDLILTPTLADLPALIGSLRNDADPAADFEAQKRFTPFTAPYNMTGQPAISLPVHWTQDGLPVGIQLVGRPMDEALVLRVAAQIERAHPWAQRHPEVW
jgi:amidase